MKKLVWTVAFILSMPVTLKADRAHEGREMGTKGRRAESVTKTSKRSPIFSSVSDCLAIVTENVSICKSTDCVAIVAKDVGTCKTSDCVAIVAKNWSTCDSTDCRAVATKNLGICESKICGAIVADESTYCY